MFTKHPSRQLAAYLDGRLAPSTLREIEKHLSQCPHCQAECDRVRQGMTAVEHLDIVAAPDAIWRSIEAAFEQQRSHKQPIPLARWAFAAVLLLGLIGVAYWRLTRPSGPRWEVDRVEGAPLVGARLVRGVGRVGVGDWLETDSKSRATVRVGTIGSVDVEPNTRVRVVAARPDEHRLALAHGEIHATISAPPKLFFVDTAAGTAIDLGCEYVLHTDENGAGVLRVTKGWVSFQWNARESLVPAGASCALRPRGGPGIPYFDDASEGLKQALDGFSSGGNALGNILDESRARDTLSLWHVLSRVSPQDRARVIDRMAALTPLPAGVSREQGLKLDPATLTQWKEELAWTW